MSQGVSNVKTELSDSNNRSSIISDIRSSSSENEETVVNNFDKSSVEEFDLISNEVLQQDFEDFDSEHQTEYINKLKTIIEERIGSLTEELQSLEKKDKMSWLDYILTALDSIKYSDEFVFSKLDSAEVSKAKTDEIKDEISKLKSISNNLQRQLDMMPYTEMMHTDSFSNFCNSYDLNNSNIDFNTLRNLGYDVTQYVLNKTSNLSSEQIEELSINGELTIDQLSIVEYIINNRPDGVSKIEAAALYPNLMDYFDLYLYTTEEERMLYHYLIKTAGVEEANNYLDSLRDQINKAKGYVMANDFISKLDFSDENKVQEAISNYFRVSARGFEDGVGTFIEGITNALENNDTISADEYCKMAILDYLSNVSAIYNKSYEFHSSLGNMVPSMVVSAAVSVIGTPAAGEIVGSALMGLSSGGNAMHQALAGGNGTMQSILYGLFIGSSEATLGYFLGKIPGLSQASGLTIKNILSEGVEEFLQEWIDAGLQATLLGNEVDLSNVTTQSIESFFMGALMASYLNGGQAIISFKIDGNSYNLDANKILEYIENNPNETIIDAIVETSEDENIVESMQARNNDSNVKGVNLEAREGVNLKEKLYKNIPSKLNKVEVAKLLYNRLNEEVSYSPEYIAASRGLFINPEVQQELLSKKIDLTNFENNNIVCTNWADMYSEMLSDFGIENYVRGVDHKWVVFRIDGVEYFADATNRYGAVNDLVAAQTGMPSGGFFEINSEIFEDDTFGDSRNQRIKELQTNWYSKYGNKIDKRIGYSYELDEKMIDKLKTKANDNYQKEVRKLGLPKDASPSQVMEQKLIQRVFPKLKELGVIEGIGYYNEILSEIENISVTCEIYTNSNLETVGVFSINNNMYLYSGKNDIVQITESQLRNMGFRPRK